MHRKHLATLLLLGALITVPMGAAQGISIYDHVMIGWLTNIRLAAFGGAGIALAPQEGVTALKVNPAATGLVDFIQANGGLGIGLMESDYDVDSTLFGLGGEGYYPIGPVTLFGHLGYGHAVNDWQYAMDDDRYGDTDFLLAGAGAGAAFLDDMLAAGGSLDLWSLSSGEYSIGPGVVLNTGFLYAAPQGFNLALTFNTESDDEDNDHFGGIWDGINSSVRVGGAWQPDGNSWLAGGEMILAQDLDHRDGYVAFHGYGEYIFDDRFQARGGFGFGTGGDYEYIQVTAGGTLRLNDSMGFDAFIGRRMSTVQEMCGNFDTELTIVGGGVVALI